MSVSFSRMREFENQRVRMAFDDGLDTLGRLLSAVEDMDGSQHLVYNEVDWSSDPCEFATARNSTMYAEGESLVSIEAIDEQLEIDGADRAERVASAIALAGKVFGDREKATEWLCSVEPALANQTPMTTLLTRAGTQLVESRLWQIDEGVYS